MSEQNDNTCAFCGEEVAMGLAHECGPKRVGEQCKCCGRVLIASNEDNETPQESESEG